MRAKEAKMNTTKCLSKKRETYRSVRLPDDRLTFDADDHREGWTVMSGGRYTWVCSDSAGYAPRGACTSATTSRSSGPR